MCQRINNVHTKFDYIPIIHFLHSVVDVSAQASCTITPISPTTLTAAGGILPNGTENVMIRCNCSKDHGGINTKVRWYGPDGIIPRFETDDYIPGAPHHIRANGGNDNRNITLVIPTFTDSYDGNYTCGRIGNKLPRQPTATVKLSK